MSTEELSPAAEARPGLPSQALSPRALTQWRAEALAWGLAAVVASIVLRTRSTRPTPRRGSSTPSSRVTTALALAAALTLPGLRWRHWRYAVDEQEIDLRHGTFTIVRTVVPMARVQHVETRRTFGSQIFDTASLAVHTAAGAVVIPLLDEAVARELRDRIALYARTPDDDDRA